MGGLLSAPKPIDPTDDLLTEEDCSNRVNELLAELEAFRDSISRDPYAVAKKNCLVNGNSVTNVTVLDEICHLEEAIMARYQRCKNDVSQVLDQATKLNIRSLKVQYTSIGKSRFGDRKNARNDPQKLDSQLCRDVLVFATKLMPPGRGAGMAMDHIMKILGRLDKLQGKKGPDKCTKSKTGGSGVVLKKATNVPFNSISPTGEAKQYTISGMSPTEKAKKIDSASLGKADSD